MAQFKLDRRTRRDEDHHFVSAREFFDQEFPRLSAKHGSLVAAGIQTYGVPPLTIGVEGTFWTIRRDGDTVALDSGATDEAVVVMLTPDQFSDWAQNQMTFNGFLVASELEFHNGTVADVSAWDSLWIALLEGWTVTSDHLAFLDRHGASLDLATSFGRRDDPADIAHFLREAGFLHLRGWFDAEDMAVIAADMDRALPYYHEGDGKSWWATIKGGARCCVRLQEFVQHSPTTAKLLSSDTWAHMRAVLGAGDELAIKPVEGRIIEALYKPVGVVSGPSDVTFHRDCHLGRHAYVCSRMTIGIALTPTGDGNGTLRVVAGSHRVAMPVEVAKTRSYLPVVALPTQAGDLTVHLSCTLHESLPPIFAERRVMYTEIPLAPPAGVTGPVDTSVNALRDRVSDLLRDRA